MKRLLPLIFLLFCHFLSPANPLDTLFKVDFKPSVGFAFQIFNQQVIPHDSAKALPMLNHFQQQANKKGRTDLQAMAMGFRAVYYFHYIPAKRDSSILFLKKALNLCDHQPKTEEMAARFSNLLGYYLYRELQYQSSLEWILRSDYKLKQIGYENIQGVDLYLYNIAVVYFGFKQYPKAIEYIKQSIAYTDSSNLESLQANYNLMGVAYSEIGEKEKALKYLQESKQYILQEGDSSKLSMIECNMGMYFTDLEQYKKAIDQLGKAYGNAEKHKKPIHAETAALWMAKAYCKQKNVAEAKEWINRAEECISKNKTTAPDNLKMFYTLKARIADFEENYQMASRFKDSVEIMNNEINEVKDLSSLAELNVKLISEKHLSEVELLEQQSEHKTAQQRLLLIISALVMLFLFHLWFQSNRKRKAERLKFEEEQAKNIEKLKDFRDRIREKNKLLEKFKRESEGNQQPHANKSEFINQLSEAVILTEDDWIAFKKLFEQAYPSFFPKIIKEFPELTQAEKRFLALLKLGLSVNEMANTLAILPQSVRKSRQRLMKKLSLSHQKELRQFVSKL